MWRAGVLLLLCCALPAFTAEDELPLPHLPGAPGVQLETSMTEVETVEHNGTAALRVRFAPGEWPNLMWRADADAWDWSGSTGLAVEVYNPEADAQQVSLRVDNPGADGTQHCRSASALVPAGGAAVIRCSLNSQVDPRFWGMRGVPGRGPVGNGVTLDTTAIVAFQIFLNRPQEPHELMVLRAWRYGQEPRASKIPFPFVDRFGQYAHAEWPGKLDSEDALAARHESELAQLRAAPNLQGRDAFGGWADGPRVEATGWFRTQQVNGKWWLVTPEGTLFLSVGMDCVTAQERTFVEQRENWFEWLPRKEHAAFGALYGETANTHSMAETIGGKGRDFSFYQANLIRKHGAAWQEPWRALSFQRLRAWGFNTVANWSSWDVLAESPLPYVVSGVISGVPEIAGAKGYWAKMKDVYAPNFAEQVELAVRGLTDTHGAKPLCIGYFLDNELAWEGVQEGALESPGGQPARQALLDFLRERHPSLDALNAAWKSGFAAWEDVRTPVQRTRAYKDDMDEYLLRFARRYFETIDAAFARHAPNQLYLGCRFASRPEPAVRACAEYADVLSFNDYMKEIPCRLYSGEKDLGKPVLIGEFHFGALDRGMFHTGLVAAENQAERARMYRHYLQRVADCPAAVGAHWFQYVDEPITGRTLDGENYNIGFVDVTDTPYPELVEAARGIHAEIYRSRYNGRPESGTGGTP